MSLAVEVNLLDTASPAVLALQTQLSPARLSAAVGPAVMLLTTRHLRANGTNRRGWPTTNFWSRAAKATSWTGTGEGVVVSINQQGVRQRWKGGRISPVHARALTIPISPEAYGKTAKDFPGAFLLKTKKGAFIVQRGEEISKTGKVRAARGKGFASKRVVAHLEFLFVLKSSVNQKPDPSVIPSMDDYGATAIRAIRERVATLTQRGGRA